MATLKDFRGFVEQQRGHIVDGRVAAYDLLDNGTPVGEELGNNADIHSVRHPHVGGVGAKTDIDGIFSRFGKRYI